MCIYLDAEHNTSLISDIKDEQRFGTVWYSQLLNYTIMSFSVSYLESLYEYHSPVEGLRQYAV